MYKISQFSKISGLTVKALRYYDSEDILKLTCRDEVNKYRYYMDEDLVTAQWVKSLRAFDFSVMEIREVLQTAESNQDFMFLLQEKIQMIEQNISKEKELIERINKSLVSVGVSQKINHYVIDVAEVEEQLAAVIRFKGRYSDLEKYVPLLYKAAKGNKAGHHFNCYYDDECVEYADIELCLPVSKMITGKDISCRRLPRIKSLRVRHYGSYETLYLAYRVLFEHVNANNIKVLTPSREIYIKGPGMIFKGNPENYITEIHLPIETQ